MTPPYDAPTPSFDHFIHSMAISSPLPDPTPTPILIITNCPTIEDPKTPSHLINYPFKYQYSN